jgi:lipoprotein signal peptidase
MFSLTRASFVGSGFVLLALLDLGLRFLWLEGSHFTCNSGALWGLPFPSGVILIGTIAILGYLFFLWNRTKDLVMRTLLLMILLGGSVNLIDRLSHGCVLDYLSWPGILESIFPRFNVGDSLILLGILCLIGCSSFRVAGSKIPANS